MMEHDYDKFSQLSSAVRRPKKPLAKRTRCGKNGPPAGSSDPTVKGPRPTVMLNGIQTVDVQDSKFASGPIALQWGRGVVRFRKMQIRPL